MTTTRLQVPGVGPVDVTSTERGAGRPVLLLHGGAGPLSVIDFADRMAVELGVHVLVPTHPGFAGSSRPEQLRTIRQLAQVYVALLDALDLDDVLVVGNSIGGWTAAEIGLLHSPQVSGLVLVDAVGIEMPGHQVTDFFSLTFPEVAALSYAHPERHRIDPAALPPAVQAAMAGNRAALAVYGGGASMTDPTLPDRLGGIDVPTLVVWGDADRIADPEVGRAFAEGVPGARFVLLPQTGHLPQLESPDLLLAELGVVLAGPVSRPAQA
jgi:pimeloyl-ACP methyl ester carboxylesterase